MSEIEICCLRLLLEALILQAKNTDTARIARKLHAVLDGLTAVRNR